MPRTILCVNCGHGASWHKDTPKGKGACFHPSVSNPNCPKRCKMLVRPYPPGSVTAGLARPSSVTISSLAHGPDFEALKVQPAIIDAYAVISNRNEPLLYTVASGRAAAWNKFCPQENRGMWQRNGYRVAPIMVKEYQK